MSRTMKKIFLLPIIIISLTISFPFSSLAKDAIEEQLYSEASILLDNYRGERLNLEKAYNLTKQIYTQNPQSPLSYVCFGRIFYKSGYIANYDYDPQALKQAQECFKKAINLAPSFFDAYFFGARSYIFSRDLLEAKKLANKAKEISPESPKVDYLFSEINFINKDYRTAIVFAENVTRKAKEKKLLFMAYYFIAKSNVYLKNYNLAEKAYLSSIKSDKNSAWSLINYGNFLLNHKKDIDNAMKYAKKALDIADMGAAHLILGKAYYKKGHYYQWKKRDYLKSREYFELSIRHNPNRPNAYYGLGMSFYRTGHKNKNIKEIRLAKNAFEKAIELKPDHNLAKENLTRVNQLLAIVDK